MFLTSSRKVCVCSLAPPTGPCLNSLNKCTCPASPNARHQGERNNLLHQWILELEGTGTFKMNLVFHWKESQVLGALGNGRCGVQLARLSSLSCCILVMTLRQAHDTLWHSLSSSKWEKWTYFTGLLLVCYYVSLVVLNFSYEAIEVLMGVSCLILEV